MFSPEVQEKIIERARKLILGKNGMIDTYHEGSSILEGTRAQMEIDLIKALKKIFPVKECDGGSCPINCDKEESNETTD